MMMIYGQNDATTNHSVASEEGFIRDWLKEQPIELGKANDETDLLSQFLSKNDMQLFSLN